MSQSAVPRFLVLLAGLLAAACEGSPEPDAALSLRPLAAAEVRQTILAHTLSRHGGAWWRAWEYAGLHREDGTMTGRVWWSDGQESAEGEWQVMDAGLYCRTWGNHWGDGRRGCFRVSRDGEILVFDHVSGASGDAERYTYRLLPGNPQGL